MLQHEVSEPQVFTRPDPVSIHLTTTPDNLVSLP